ncbi:Short-chain dehydrogenase of various substrate specificities (plasmid) [Rubrobacter radiotolerans]|uniref:SDR family NAD(P)-dependent oxidoreductase n=1 Tax=Rubrobacter radiotolerans TaxID=42256 RepID=A0A023X8A0_RUBRA|nr:SDR family NAD(P)-dependent oxidoreductase [Rubrobacter radiotolerans]AHY48294.1 Short-chain dehydrogenase of various substrate specificities [Rubrobacter radiotolerans]MDX5895567.1 SDR family NAD(P)-dependent oxidoreductase [Rubrobacter radiotolerans]SMC01491.1 Short-chain dehydrogenase [Rubrobacter radiotolerans DSM 5868]
MRLYGRVAAVTGAGSGIGRELAIGLARRGCELALSDIDEVSLARTVETVRFVNPRLAVSCERVDVADRDALYAWAGKTAERHGRVNAVFNNAGVALGSTVEGASDGDLEWLFGINFWGVVHGTRAFLPHLRVSGEGHVVNVSSVFALISVPGQAAYNASKSAVRGFTDALRMELEMSGAPVRATTVLPGGIKTNVARASRANGSLADLGLDAARGREKFERLFITDSDRAAGRILDAVERDRERVLIGPDAYVIDALSRLFPAGYARLVKRSVRRSLG